MNFSLPIKRSATASGMTNTPTNQSAIANDITKQLVTVLNLLVVKTARMTKVFPITVIIINTHKSATNASS